MADSCIFFLNTLCLLASYCDLWVMNQQYSYAYGHWALHREKWPEEVSTWIFCYNDMLFNRFVFTKKHFGWYWWPEKELHINFVFYVESPSNYLFDCFTQRGRVAFFQSDRFYSATDTSFNYAAIQRFYLEQQILCDYHFDGGNPQPQHVYTKNTYYNMFFFTWFTMCCVADVIYYFDLF